MSDIGIIAFKLTPLSVFVLVNNQAPNITKPNGDPYSKKDTNLGYLVYGGLFYRYHWLIITNFLVVINIRLSHLQVVIYGITGQRFGTCIGAIGET